MSKPVKDLVDKRWATEAREILTGNSPDTTTLFEKLLTLTRFEQSLIKTTAARVRYDTALDALMAAVKFGWAHGINESQARYTRPRPRQPSRRVGALIPLAVEAGRAIGEAQAKRIARAHGIPKPGTFSLKHTHAPQPGAADGPQIR